MANILPINQPPISSLYLTKFILESSEFGVGACDSNEMAMAGGHQLGACASLICKINQAIQSNFAISRDPNPDRQSRSDVAGKRSTPLLLASTVFPKLKFQFKTQETLSNYSLSSLLRKTRSPLHLPQTPIALPPTPPRSPLFPLLHLTDSPLVAPPQTGKPKPAPTDSPLIAPPTGNPKPAPTTTEARPPPSLLPHSNYQCTNVPEAQDVRAMTG
ncbi:hypothetical protein RHMOL_Rhmol02G0114200 [Rhododendron molle]|uniref:Uncharacterized protein n=1 Tax=Rhododendron molle TaxID=49168 RepID=A0ACC0PRN4_RHOML|nr:hypothetical protein RHMOL_Rhmol02G0114200 [Rhododendron molle]